MQEKGYNNKIFLKIIIYENKLNKENYENWANINGENKNGK